MRKIFFLVSLILLLSCLPALSKDIGKELVLKELKFHIRKEWINVCKETPFNYRLIDSKYMKHLLSDDFFKPMDIYKKQSCFRFLQVDNSKIPSKCKGQFFLVEYRWYWKLYLSEDRVPVEYYRIYLSHNNKVFVLNEYLYSEINNSEFNCIPYFMEFHLNDKNIMDYLSFFLYWTSNKDKIDSAFIIKDQKSKQAAIKEAKLNMDSPELNSLADLEKTIKIQEIDEKYYYVRCLAYFPSPIKIYNDQILECIFLVSKSGEIIGFDVRNPFK